MKNATLQQMSKSYPHTVPAPVVSVRGGQVVASSLDVAEFFGKRHGSVLRSIRTLDCSPVFREHNFVFSKYKPTGSRRSYTCFEMTREGFVRLVSNFDGPEAARFMESYINEFSRMETALKAAPPAVHAIPQTMPEALRLAADAMERAEAAEGRAEVAEAVNRRLSDASGLIGLRDAAKMLKIDLSELRRLIIDVLEWGFPSEDPDDEGRTKPYREAVRAGLMDTKPLIIKGKRAISATFLTPKGLDALARHLCQPMKGAEFSAALN